MKNSIMHYWKISKLTVYRLNQLCSSVAVYQSDTVAVLYVILQEKEIWLPRQWFLSGSAWLRLVLVFVLVSIIITVSISICININIKISMRVHICSFMLTNQQRYPSCLFVCFRLCNVMRAGRVQQYQVLREEKLRTIKRRKVISKEDSKVM